MVNCRSIDTVFAYSYNRVGEVGERAGEWGRRRGEGGRREGDRYETLGLSDGSELEEEEECGGGGIKKLKGFTIVSLDDEGLE